MTMVLVNVLPQGFSFRISFIIDQSLQVSTVNSVPKLVTEISIFLSPLNQSFHSKIIDNYQPEGLLSLCIPLEIIGSKVVSDPEKQLFVNNYFILGCC